MRLGVDGAVLPAERPQPGLCPLKQATSLWIGCGKHPCEHTFGWMFGLDTALLNSEAVCF